MNIVIVGKYPPIEGGVSMRTWRYAHGLAARGHRIRVVTNADEVAPPFRMFMRAEDWARCEADDGDGSVRVSWTEPPDRRQAHIPMGSAFATKLASVGIEAAAEIEADVVFSYYAEPYAVAGHLTAEACGLPHVVRTAGSDAGRLWDHPQLGPLYGHIFRSAAAVLAGGPVAGKMIRAGVDPARLVNDGDFGVDTGLFQPDCPALDLDRLADDLRAQPEFRPQITGAIAADMPYVGVYGKLGPAKGTLPLLRALARLDRPVGLLMMAHARPRDPADYFAEAESLGIADRIVRLPFLPPWRVPEFIRRCLAVCCLEQDFPIAIHTPIVAREVLACGGCLIGSTEVIRKLSEPKLLADRYNCIALDDVNDDAALAAAFDALLDRPSAAADAGRRGAAYVREVQRHHDFPAGLEAILEAVVARLAQRPVQRETPVLSTLALGALDRDRRDALFAGDTGDPLVAAVRDAIRFDTLLAAPAPAAPGPEAPDTLRRLQSDAVIVSDDALAQLRPRKLTPLDVVRFDHDVSDFLDARDRGTFPETVSRHPTAVATRPATHALGDGPFILDALETQLIDVADGNATVAEIAAGMPDRPADEVVAVIRTLFEIGLLALDASSA